MDLLLILIFYFIPIFLDNAVLRVENGGISKYNVATNQTKELLSRKELVRAWFDIPA